MPLTYMIKTDKQQTPWRTLICFGHLDSLNLVSWGWSVQRTYTLNTEMSISKGGVFFFLSFCFCHSASTLIAFNSSSHLCSFRWTNYVNLLSKKFVLNGKMVQFKWFSFPGPSSFQTVPNNSFAVWIFGVFCSQNIQYFNRLFSTFHKQTVLMRQNKIFTNTQRTILLPGGGGCRLQHQAPEQHPKKRKTKAKMMNVPQKWRSNFPPVCTLFA